jgi:hypothetical protein
VKYAARPPVQVAAACHHPVMGDAEAAPARSRAQRVVGRIAVGVVAVLAVAGVLAFCNPWHLVVVERVLAIPAVGVVAAVVFGCAVAALPVPADGPWPFTPDQRVLAAVGVPLTVCMIWGMAVPGWPTHRPRELARSPDGDRAVVLRVSTAGGRCLYVWVGHGLGARVSGALGDPGHDPDDDPDDDPVVSFEGRDLVVVQSSRRFEVRLDPATGRPLRGLDEPCSPA